MVKKNLADNILQDEIYTGRPFPVPKLIIVGFIAMTLGFFSNFSFSRFIISKIESSLTQNPNCPIQYKKLETSFLLTGITFTDFNIPSQCFNTMGPSLLFQALKLQWRGISFYPFGLKFRLNVEGVGNKGQAVLALGLPSSMLRIQETQLDADLINTIIGKPKLLKGTLKIEMQSSLSGLDLNDASVLITSNNFSIPSQNISGLNLPPLQLNQLAAKLRLESGQFLNVENITIGSDGAPMIARVQGTIDLNKNNMNLSSLNLEAELKIAPELNESFPILNLFLGNKPQREGFYILKVGGSVGAPQLL